MPSLVWNLAPDQLTFFPGPPTVDALLIHNLAGFQSHFFGLKSLADIDIVDTARVPDADVTLATEAMMEEVADLFGGLAGDARYADLPAGLVFYDFSIPKGQTLVLCDIADGADIDSAVGSVLHNSFSFHIKQFRLKINWAGLSTSPRMQVIVSGAVGGCLVQPQLAHPLCVDEIGSLCPHDTVFSGIVPY